MASGHVLQGTVHHLGLQTDDLDGVVTRLRELGVSVTDIRHEPTAEYAMAKGPDELLIEIFRPDPARVPRQLRGYFDLPDPPPDVVNAEWVRRYRAVRGTASDDLDDYCRK